MSQHPITFAQQEHSFMAVLISYRLFCFVSFLLLRNYSAEIDLATHNKFPVTIKQLRQIYLCPSDIFTNKSNFLASRFPLPIEIKICRADSLKGKAVSWRKSWFYGLFRIFLHKHLIGNCCSITLYRMRTKHLKQKINFFLSFSSPIEL